MFVINMAVMLSLPHSTKNNLHVLCDSFLESVRLKPVYSNS